MAEARRQAPGRRLEIWAFDEHRLGLKPIRRRVWAKIGRRPLGRSSHKYQWHFLYAFVHPSSGAVEWWLASSVSVGPFPAVLDAFAKTVGAGKDKCVVLLIDNAGWHVANKLKPPEGLRFSFLPPYSPELQPAERLWPLTDEAAANKAFDSLEELEQALDQRCSALTDQPDLLKAHTKFHWWPSE